MDLTRKSNMQDGTADGTMRNAETQLRARMPLDLGDGLQLRFAQRRDIDLVVELAQSVWGQEALGIWVRDFMEGRHPNVSYRDYTVAEELATGRIVSCSSLISQTWSYGGVQFRCGQPEMIVTHPDYRRRGLVRAQMDLIHKLSSARGELMQAIMGRNWYYRQFGYEYAMANVWGSGWRIHQPQIPMLAEGEAEPFSLRPMRKEDHALVRRLYEIGSKRGCFSVVKEEEDWNFLFRGYSDGAMMQYVWYTICDSAGVAIGFLAQHDSPWWQCIHRLELAQGYSYLQVMPSILRQLQQIVPDHVQVADPAMGRPTVEFRLPSDHPVGQALAVPHEWIALEAGVLYIRIPDLVSFLRHIRPALETNLVGTVADGYSGDLNISCYRWGVRLEFESGRITAIEQWHPEDFGHKPAFPELTVLQLICGFRRCADLIAAFPDCSIDNTNVRLLDALFPPFRGGLWLGSN